METVQTKRCDNLSCVCDVPLTEAACSEYCARVERGDGVSLKCECGHAPCAQEMERELTGAMGSRSAP